MAIDGGGARSLRVRQPVPRRALTWRFPVRGVGRVERRAQRGAGDERNETVHKAVQSVEGAPDLCLLSHVAKGPHVGYRRICNSVDAVGAPLMLKACGRVLDVMPWIAADAAGIV